MAEFAALPLFTDAYLADTEHLSDAEHGIYLKLLMVMWRSPQCRLPNDDAWLARRFHKTPEEVGLLLRPLLREFCESDGNWLTQKRLKKEWIYCQRKRKANSVAAKYRWNKEKSTSERNAADSDVRNAPSPSPSPSPSPFKESISIKSWPSDYRERFWSEYPRRVGKSAALRKLEGIKRSGEVEFDNLLSAVRLISASEERFIPHPLTWLNQGRYLDGQPVQTALNGSREYRPPPGSGLPTDEELRARYADRGKTDDVAKRSAGVLAQGAGICAEKSDGVDSDKPRNARIRGMD